MVCSTAFTPQRPLEQTSNKGERTCLRASEPHLSTRYRPGGFSERGKRGLGKRFSGIAIRFSGIGLRISVLGIRSIEISRSARDDKGEGRDDRDGNRQQVREQVSATGTGTGFGDRLGLRFLVFGNRKSDFGLRFSGFANRSSVIANRSSVIALRQQGPYSCSRPRFPISE